MRYGSILLGALVSASSISLPAIAQERCQPLKLVGGIGLEITKTVSPPTVPVPLPGPFSTQVRNNWNTDWIVPGGQVFRRFVVTISLKDDVEYGIAANLKYPDQTADNFFDNKAVTPAMGRPLRLEASSRNDMQPYQVNVSVGGVPAIGKSYAISVLGCL